jgi:T3SS negative regulator,GrlR
MNGLWTAEFGSSTGMFGGGVAVFRDGEILGGDGTYYYVGRYTLTGNAFVATLIVSPFIEGAESVFKTVGRVLTLELVGSLIDQGRATAQGHPKGMPDLKFGVKLTKRD